LLGLDDLVLEVAHAFVLYIQLPFEFGQLLLDLRVFVLVYLAGLH
jgi:hypothetical protein